MTAPARKAHAPDWIGVRDLEVMFGLSAGRLAERRAEWEAQGFPAPLPWRKKPLTWRRDAVERWKTQQERRCGATGAGDA